MKVKRNGTTFSQKDGTGLKAAIGCGLAGYVLYRLASKRGFEQGYDFRDKNVPSDKIQNKSDEI